MAGVAYFDQFLNGLRAVQFGGQVDSRVLDAIFVLEYLVNVGVRVDGLLQRLLVGMAKGELQRLVRVGLEE